MEHSKRSVVKALTWQFIGFVVMSIVNYYYLGSLRSGVGLSALLTMIGLVSYYFHERVWERIHWGRRRGRSQP